MDVGEVLVKIQGDVTGLTAAVNNAIRTIDKIQDSTKKTEKTVTDSFKTIGGSAMSMASQIAGAFGIAFSATAMISFIRTSIDAVARINDLAQQTGIAGSTLLGLKSIAEEAGSSIELFARAGFMAQRQLAEIKTTSDPTYQAMQKLIAANKDMKLSYEDFTRADPGEFMELLAKSLQNVADYQEKVNIVSGFFGGRIGKEMLPILDAMARGFDKILTDDQIAMVDDFTDRMTRLSNIMAAITVEQLLASMKDLKQAFDDIVGSIDPLPEYISDFVGWLNRSTTSIQGTERDILNLTKAYKYFMQGQAELRQFFLHPFKPDPALDAYIREKAQEIADINDRIASIGQPSSHTPVPEKGGGRGAGGINVGAALDQKKAIEGFIDSLKGQNDALLAAQYAFNHTEAEVKAFTLQQEKATFINKLLRDSLLKTVPPELLRQIDDWIAKITDSAKAVDEYKGALSDAAQSSEILDKAMAAFGKVQSASFSDVQKQLNEIDDELAQTIAAYNTAAANQALPPWMDVEELRNAAYAVADIKRQMIIAAAQGPTRQEQIELLDEEAAKRQQDAFKGLQTSLSDLYRQQLVNKDLSDALGKSYDDVSARIDNQRQIIENIIQQMRSGQLTAEEYALKVKQLGNALAGFNTDVGLQRAKQLGDNIANSLTQGIRNTLMGVETGQQTLGDAMKNLVRNMVLELQFTVLDQTILGPIKMFASGFVQGLVGSISDEFANSMEDLGKRLGAELNKMLSDMMQSSQVSKWVGMGLSFLGSMFGAAAGPSMGEAGGTWGNIPIATGAPEFQKGGPLTYSGLFRGHAGEVVLNNAAVRRLGGMSAANALNAGRGGMSGGNVQVSLDFQGAQIIPRAPWTTPDDVIKVSTKHINDDGMMVAAMGNRLSRRR